MKPSQLIFLPIALLALPCAAVEVNEALATSLAVAAFGPEASSSNFSLAAIQLGADQQDKLSRDIDDLDGLVTGLTAEGNTPELKPLLIEVEALINATLDQVIVAWNVTWNIMNKSNASFEDCWYRQVYLGDMDEYASAHYYCRLEEAAAYTAYDDACEIADEKGTNMWQKCWDFRTIYNPVSELVPEICEPNGHLKGQLDLPAESNLDRALRLQDWFADRSAEWHSNYTACELKYNESIAANETCYDATARWKWHQNRCDLLQEKMDWVGCNYYRRNNCTEHERCWIDAEKHWTELNATVYKKFNMHWVEWAGLRRIRCLIRAIGVCSGCEIDGECYSNFTEQQCPGTWADRETEIEDCRLGAKTGVSYDFKEILESVEQHMQFRWTIGPDEENPTSLGGDPSTWSPDANFVIIKPLYCKKAYPGCPEYPDDPPCQDMPVPPIADVKPGTLKGDRTEWLEAYLTPKNFLPADKCSDNCPWPVKAPWAPCKSVCCTICFFFEECKSRPHVLNSHDVEVFPGIFSATADKTCCQTADWNVTEWSGRCDTGCGSPAKVITRTVKCIGQPHGQVLDFAACSDERLDNIAEPDATFTCEATDACDIGCDKPCPVGHWNIGCSNGSTSQCTWCTTVEGHYFTADGGRDDSCPTERCEIEECGLGQFLDQCEGHATKGVCRMCTISAGHFVTGRGLYKPRSCPTQPCDNCSDGFYRAGCGLGPGECKPCTAVPGKFFTGPGENDLPASCPDAECEMDCPLGQHRVGCAGASPGQCEICPLPAHTYAIDFGRQHDRCNSFPCAPDKCSPGKYLAGCEGTSQGVCEKCNDPPLGYWYKKHGQYDPNCTATKCVNCTAGYYREHCGGAATPTHGGQCKICTMPPRGYFHVTHGGVTNKCEAKSCTAEDMKCPKGQYRWNCGGHLKGACVACDAPPEGRYQIADGGITKTCPDAACDASKCAVGFFLKSCGGRQHPIKSGTCVPCTPPRPDFYLSSHGGVANTCTYLDCQDLEACPAGQYRGGCGGHDNPTSIGQCLPCTNREDGFYFISHGGLTPDKCQKRSCRTLAPCKASHYRKDCGTENAPASVGSCSPCTEPPFGKFSSTTGGECSFDSCTDKEFNPIYPCGAGQYLLGCGKDPDTDSKGVCTSCSNPSANMYFSAHGGIKDECAESSCEAPALACGIGQYRKNCGGGDNPASEGECAPCTAPGAGNYTSGPGTILNDPGSCAQSKCLDVGNCEPGYYRKDCGEPPLSIGTCVNCKTPVAAGFYYTGNGGFTDNCTVASCADLPNCPTGQYRSGCGISVEPDVTKGALSPGECTPCDAPASKMYITGHGGLQSVCQQTNCTSAPTCPIGQYRAGCGTNPPTGMGNCLACNPGQLGTSDYFYTDGGLDGSCLQDACANVGDCGIGHFRAKCGGADHPASKGECQPCSNLPLGMRWTTGGSLTDSCKYEPVPPR